MRLHPVSEGLCTCWVSTVLVVPLSDAGQDATIPRVPGGQRCHLCPEVAQSTQAPLLHNDRTLPSLARYLEAIRRLKTEGKSFARTIHLTFVPGESPGCPLSGGTEGAACLPWQPDSPQPGSPGFDLP